MAGGRDGDIRFECLSCGQVSRIERVGAVQPRCAQCGSGTGVLGDIGQGTKQQRKRRNAVSPQPAELSFECLRCGSVTQVEKIEIVHPQCRYCGAKDGVVVDPR